MNFDNIYFCYRLAHMILNRFLILIFFCSSSVLCFGQDTRNVEAPKPPRPAYQAYKKEKKGLFAFLRKSETKQLKTPEEESAAFRARIRQVNKENAKEQNKIDRMERKKAGYFGHKRPPKKRPPGKQKFCKVCKIKH